MDWTHGGEFPVANFSRVQTVGMEQMHAEFSRLVRPHRMDLTDQRSDFVSELRYAPLSRSVLCSTNVGAAMKVRAQPSRDACLVLAPLNTHLGMTIGTRRMVIPAGVVRVIPPDTPFTIDIPHGNCRSLMFDVEMGYLEALLAEETGDGVSQALRFLNEGSTSADGDRSFLKLMTFVKEELALGTVRAGSRVYVSRLEDLIASALLYSKPNNYSTCLQRNESVAEPRYVRRAEDFMRAHAGDGLTLKSIGVAVAVSPRSLVRGFRKYKSCSPMSYLRHVRLENCHRELSRSVPEDTSVTAVAMKWGFSNIGRFAHLYRQRYGENPVDTLRRRPAVHNGS